MERVTKKVETHSIFSVTVECAIFLHYYIHFSSFIQVETECTKQKISKEFDHLSRHQLEPRSQILKQLNEL